MSTALNNYKQTGLFLMSLWGFNHIFGGFPKDILGTGEVEPGDVEAAEPDPTLKPEKPIKDQTTIAPIGIGGVLSRVGSNIKHDLITRYIGHISIILASSLQSMSIPDITRMARRYPRQTMESLRNLMDNIVRRSSNPDVPDPPSDKPHFSSAFKMAGYGAALSVGYEYLYKHKDLETEGTRFFKLLPAALAAIGTYAASVGISQKSGSYIMLEEEQPQGPGIVMQELLGEDIYTQEELAEPIESMVIQEEPSMIIVEEPELIDLSTIKEVSKSGVQEGKVIVSVDTVVGNLNMTQEQLDRVTKLNLTPRDTRMALVIEYMKSNNMPLIAKQKIAYFIMIFMRDDKYAELLEMFGIDMNGIDYLLHIAGNYLGANVHAEHKILEIVLSMRESMKTKAGSIVNKKKKHLIIATIIKNINKLKETEGANDPRLLAYYALLIPLNVTGADILEITKTKDVDISEFMRGGTFRNVLREKIRKLMKLHSASLVSLGFDKLTIKSLKAFQK